MRNTLAVVIKTVDFKETDKMITFLTKDYGIMSAKVTGAKKQTSKLFSSSSLFCCGEYGFYEKSGFFGVKSCDIKCTFFHLQNDFDAYSAACFIADAVGKVAQEDFAAPKLFALVVNVLYALDKAAVSPGSAVCYFIQRMLLIEGLYPNLDSCVFCDKETALTRFSVAHGGAVCAECGKQYGGAHIDGAFLDTMKDMGDILPKDIGLVCIPKQTEKKLAGVLIAYLEHALQQPLKTTRFIKDAL